MRTWKCAKAQAAWIVNNLNGWPLACRLLNFNNAFAMHLPNLSLSFLIFPKRFMLVFGGQEHTCRVVISDQSGLLPVPKGEGKWARPDSCLGSGCYVETLSIVEPAYCLHVYIIYRYFDVNLLGTLLFPERHRSSVYMYAHEEPMIVV